MKVFNYLSNELSLSSPRPLEHSYIDYIHLSFEKKSKVPSLLTSIITRDIQKNFEGQMHIIDITMFQWSSRAER